MEPLNTASNVIHPSLDSATQWWFNVLDQRRIGSRSKSWIVQIAGIHADGSDLWIQSAPSGQPTRSIVLHVSTQASVGEAMTALEEAWSEKLADRTVIHLTRVA